MQITPQSIPDVLLIEVKRHGDARGFFSETFRADRLAEAGFSRPFVQDNHSATERRGSVRGLHYQIAPYEQDKLIRVVRGSVYDVAVDIRPGSATFGRHVAVELSAENGRQLLVPRGFAHGFQTLTDDAEVLYKVTGYYAPESERGVHWQDPELGIDWPIAAADVFLNERDRTLPGLKAASLA